MRSLFLLMLIFMMVCSHPSHGGYPAAEYADGPEQATSLGFPGAPDESFHTDVDQYQGTSGNMQMPNLLNRLDYSDTNQFVIQMVDPLEYTEIELLGNMIRIPEGAIGELMSMALGILDCPYIVYIAFPSGIQFEEPVDLEFSYDKADLSGIDETTIRIYRYDNSIRQFEFVGGEVDTINNIVSVSVNEFPPPGEGGGMLVRYVLADE